MVGDEAADAGRAELRKESFRTRRIEGLLPVAGLAALVLVAVGIMALRADRSGDSSGDGGNAPRPAPESDHEPLGPAGSPALPPGGSNPAPRSRRRPIQPRRPIRARRSTARHRRPARLLLRAIPPPQRLQIPVSASGWLVKW
jgi:hypothetical protein